LGYSLIEPEPENSETAFKRLSQPVEVIQARSDAAWKQFRNFKDTLTERGAELLLSDPSQHAVNTCVEASPAWGRDLAGDILRAEPHARARARNFALVLAQALAPHDAVLSEALYRSVVDLPGRLTLTSGHAKIPLDQMVAWQARASGGWDAIRRARLDLADNDHDLAREVLSATVAGQVLLLDDIVSEYLASSQPVTVARGLTILGFSAQSASTAEYLGKAATAPGFLGEAARKAKAAHDRAEWARTWRVRMIEAKDPTEYWQAGVLVAKLVDQRWDLWDLEPISGSLADQFDPLFEPNFRRRLERWEQKRKSTLFGQRLSTIHFTRDTEES